MKKEWTKCIADAQQKATCLKNGKEYFRIKFGDEKDDWGADNQACGDCGAVKGEYHVPGCDVESCPECGGQMIGCECSPSKKAKKPAKPFSKRELAIVEARKLFKWRHIGFAANGDSVFEVSNNSQMVLPYLSIGVQGNGGSKLIGGAWLNVSAISPGHSGKVDHQCYKELMSPEEHEFFDTSDPNPETRDRFWEFKRLPKSK